RYAFTYLRLQEKNFVMNSVVGRIVFLSDCCILNCFLTLFTENEFNQGKEYSKIDPTKDLYGFPNNQI
ncbi:hypothetical protein BpHYR1_040119, partial [Brachionus plicatilis]